MIYYAVTAGSYSDYHIVGVTANKEKAEKIVKAYNKRYSHDEADIEEYEDFADTIDFLEIDNPCYEVIKHKTHIYCKEVKYYDYNDIGKVRKYITSGALILNVFADSEEKALKIAYDKFAQYEAQKQGLC